MGINAIGLPNKREMTAPSGTGVSEIGRLKGSCTSATTQKSVLLLDRRTLDRDCLSRSLEANDSDLSVKAFASLEDWFAVDHIDIPSAVIFVFGGVTSNDKDNFEKIREITNQLSDVPLIVIADTDEIGQMFKALEYGASGYIPSSVGVSVAVEAIRLARAGGVFLPASGILAARKLIKAAISDASELGNLFTPREAQVAEALRRGKANKIIAHELELRESTVKVHIRNIMKKLNATNRTEVAYRLSEMI